ncbi:DUF2635 domain-containing protein [Paraburkholderia caribensis]|uniref:DUF2635 domain-containing protein n=1 Tax=Paraburkholderia caribensis TaxID=75105 RepID=UPI001CB2256F|nr:DUF2635 domain-containing protein [Paraburkholderia caribensis]CAG9256244.1 conserved hypothetical protein [Paraburkholderia caribensis]
MFVKPAAGMKIRDPDMKDFLPDEGRDVPDDHLYWVKRLNDKDVVLAEQPSPLEGSQQAAVMRDPDHAETNAVDDTSTHRDGSD